MHENQGDGYFCRSLNEKGEEGVAFAANETTCERCTRLAASGNEPKVVILWVCFFHGHVVGVLSQACGS